MGNERDLAPIATFYRRLQWTALVLGVLWVVWLLAPILSPFVFAALLGFAYAAHAWGWRRERWWAPVLVFVAALPAVHFKNILRRLVAAESSSTPVATRTSAIAATELVLTPAIPPRLPTRVTIPARSAAVAFVLFDR